MKEPLSHKVFAFLEPQQKAPVKGFLIEKKGTPSSLDIKRENIKIKGSEYQIQIPWGVGVETKNFGIWSVLHPETPSFVKSKEDTLELTLPAANDIKITYKGSVWLIVLDREYDKVDLAAQRDRFFKRVFKFIAWLSLATAVHVLLYYVALYVPLKPISWIENTVNKSSADLPTFEEQIIDQAKKNTVAVNPEDDVIKVKFNFFNGLPWMDQKKVTEQNVQRLDNLLKDLKGKDLTIGFDDKGATNAADVLKQAQKSGVSGQKGSLISQVFSKSNTLVNPKLSDLKSSNRNLSAAELKKIREVFQAITPEMTLAYQRSLSRNPLLAFGLRYETTVNANGYLTQVKFSTSGVENETGLSDLLKEIKSIFEKTSIGSSFSGVTIQGENLFKSQ